MLKVKLESHTSSEIIAARDATAKALQEVEAGWKRAQDVIGQRAGLTQDAAGNLQPPGRCRCCGLIDMWLSAPGMQPVTPPGGALEE